MQDTDHVGEDAELYALGALDEAGAARVERHVRDCGSCARRVGEAEATVLQLVPAQDAAPPLGVLRFERRAARAGWPAAVAAALLIGLLPWGMSRLHPAAGSGADQAQTAMLDGHFAHAPFVARVPGAPRGKLIYALRGGWLYVIVAPGRDALDVAVVRAHTRSVVASIPPGATTRSAFVRTHGRPNAVVLLDGGLPVASAATAYAPAR